MANISEELLEASADVNLSDEEGADNSDQISHDSSDSEEVDSSDIETNEIPEVDAELGNFLFCVFNRPVIYQTSTIDFVYLLIKFSFNITKLYQQDISLFC